MRVIPYSPDNNPSDIALVQAARSGNDRAYTLLMNRYLRPIQFMVLSKVHRQSEAEEIAMETFGKAFLNLHQYETDFAFSSWLFRIAQNSTVDYVRRKKAFKNLLISRNSAPADLLSESLIRIPCSNDNPEDRLIKAENARLVRQLIATLKPRYRRLMEMHYLQECSYPEMATALNLPVGTIKVQLCRCRKILTELIRKSEMSA